MLSAVIDFFSPRRRAIRRLLGKHARPVTGRRYIVSFGDDEWGFSDASLKPLQGALSELNPGYLQMFHNRVILSFENDRVAADAALRRLSDLRHESVFECFRVGFAEDDCAADWWRVCAAAIADERSSEKSPMPNKAPEPTSGTVTPRAEPRVAPVPPVAHL